MVRDSFDSLPPLLAELADIIGLEATMTLAEHHGGQRIAVPGKMKPDHWLAGLLGFEAATALSAYVTDGNRVHLDIPYGPAWTKADKWRRTAEMIDKGKSANEIAQALGLTRRAVFDRKKRLAGTTATSRTGRTNEHPDLFKDLDDS